jgi:hypothetical protein
MVAIFLTALCISFAAFCVWLTVRIVNRRERWAKRLAGGIAVGLPVFYVLSFGPACWMAGNSPWLYDQPGRLKLVATAYRPLVSLETSGPRYVSACVCWYAGLFPNGDNGRHLMAIVLGIESLPTPLP